ncbi:MAG: phosphotransferase [Planctomycetota bacterium]
MRSNTGERPREFELEGALARFLAGEEAFKSRLEHLVRELPASEADALMMLMKESRGAWALLLERSSGTVLFLGSALSGTPVALGTLGFDVVVLDASAARLGFAVARANALVPGTTRAVLAGADAGLPFVDEAFDVVVVEGGLPSAATGWGFDMDEVRRVAREECVVTTDNRFGYKRSTGRRGIFRRDPRVLAREIVRPTRGEMGLVATRSAVAGDWNGADAYSLYPHALEFSHVVALDADRPRLTIGPRERRNRVKMLGYRLGLFSLLTPSFAVHARRSPGRESRLDRLLDRIAEWTGEPRPQADVLVATRSNDALVQTAVPGRTDAPGRWTIHIALQPAKRRMVQIHHDWLERVRERFPNVPVPEPLFLGRLEGADVAVERRVGGLNGTDVTGDRPRTSRMFADAARRLVHLLEPAPVRFDEELYESLLGERFARVLGLIPSVTTRSNAERIATEVRERLVGREMRLGVYHADLRAKHVQVDDDGALLGILDWGASEPRFLPLIDLLHLVIHQRKQEEGGTFGDAWRAVRDGRTRTKDEGAVLEAYCAMAGVDEDVARVVLDAYPLLVAGMAERNWDYSRPDWVARQFGI